MFNRIVILTVIMVFLGCYSKKNIYNRSLTHEIDQIQQKYNFNKMLWLDDKLGNKGYRYELFYKTNFLIEFKESGPTVGEILALFDEPNNDYNKKKTKLLYIIKSNFDSLEVEKELYFVFNKKGILEEYYTMNYCG